MRDFHFHPCTPVVFTEEAVERGLGDKESHYVVRTITVPDEYMVPPEYIGFSGLIGQYAGKLRRVLVGHHQWVILENGVTYSAALVQVG